MNADDLEKMGFKETSPGVYERTRNHRILPNPKPERNQAPALGKAKEGATPLLGRVSVSITGHRVRPCDPDRFSGGLCDLIDGLRHAKLLRDDNAWEMRLQTEQVKVSSYKEEKTVIRITYP